MSNDIQPNTNDWCLCHNICCLSGILQEACLFALYEALKQVTNNVNKLRFMQGGK